MNRPLGLFAGYGIELEYMVVARDSLDVLPVTDRILHSVSGAFESEVECGPLAWSNELVLHVIELKTNGPANTLDGLADVFQTHVGRINDVASEFGGMLMPTAMHPWMNPLTETRIWPHEYSPVYEAFHRVFGCRGHGWSNLQCTHLNFPFADDYEFGRLHAAIRMLLPILPGLCASSPVCGGRDTGLADARLEAYRMNARRIPSVAGAVIPEPVYSRRAYERDILEPLYHDMAPHDPEGILQYEWLNARGAIARFDRNTIEIRVPDIQECPAADLAITQLVTETLMGLVAERWCSFDRQKQWEVAPLASIFLASVRDGCGTILDNADYLRMFGGSSKAHRCVRDLWQHLFEELFPGARGAEPALRPLRVIFDCGCLSKRIRRAMSGDASPARLAEIYRELCGCLRDGRMFDG